MRGVLDPKFNIQGFRRANLKPYLPKLTDSSLSRQINRLQLFGMINRVPGTYRCYLTKLGRAATAACVHATEFNILPTLATAA
jgi:DNA-binding HxlR family transcriptional regulator